MRRESLDAPEDRPTQALRQLALRQLEDTVPRVPEEAPAIVHTPATAKPLAE